MPTIETPVVPITLLDAVNMLLESVSLSSVQSLLPEDLDEAAGEALRTIGWQSRRIQLKGWNFNTLDEVQCTPNADNEILVPPDWTSVVPGPCTPASVRFTKRGNRLKDLTTGLYTWTTGFKVRVVEAVEFADLPEPFRWYITALAGRQFGLPRSPDSLTFRWSAEVVKTATEDAEDFDGKEGGAWLPSTSPHHAFMRRKR